jgi:osmoprotectant transport system permease protein
VSRFLSLYGEKLVAAFMTHLVYVVVSVSIAFAAALLLGILLSRAPKLAGFMLPLMSIFQTIPGIVFIGILFLYFGMKPITVITALSLYAVFPILKNTYVGLMEVPAAYIEAAKGCGMSSVQTLARVELPSALPSIISGLRMSAVYTVNWAVLTAMIGLGGLGELIFAGINSNNNALILAGALPAAVMAVMFSQAIDLIRKLLIPKQIRRDIT